MRRARSPDPSAGDGDGDGIADQSDACPNKPGWPKHDGCPNRYIVSERIFEPPKRDRVRRRFIPEAQPSPHQALRISRLERERWGGPSIDDRMRCESRLLWNATNGSFRGLLQIGSWWEYAYPKTPRGVTVRRTKHRRAPVIRVRRWSDGRVDRDRIGSRRQRLDVILEGKLPRNASPYHGWAAIRVGQRAVSGDGPSTYWECGL
ncbi:MAG: hypothetical protein H0W09_02185 [Solirubrobacterales bacterium]|nr:hypothetical protein [Solirubrobacterales bacterium]